ncbi:drs2 neo1 protein, partial [Coemansia sp. 'formosensis']
AVKIFQCWFIQQDVSMYHAESDSRAEARTTAINEDLGMVRYVFSDKTGTLTENIMKLRAVMVAGFSYLHMDLDRLKANTEVSEPLVPDERNSSRLSFMRPPSSLAGNNGPQSPSLRRAQLAQPSANIFHRRQQSLPASAPIFQGLGTPIAGVRTLQQLAVTNRAAAGSNAGRRSPFGHSRGVSSAAVPPSSLRFPALRLESLSTDDDPDPDLVDNTGNGPETHTPAADDAPISDLQALPSSRTIMDGLSPPTDVFKSRAEWFLRCLALCHTVQPDRDPLTGRITGYQATSPDEKALVAAAAELGYVMNNRAGPLVQLRVVASERMRDFSESLANEIFLNSASPPPPPSSSAAKSENESFDRGVPAPDPTDRLGNYEVLDVLEFSSARKRMSVIYRCPDGRIVMVSKGADSALWPRLAALEQIKSDPADVSFIPRPPPPPAAVNEGSSALRRKLSHPSAAYLHSRNSSVASQADFVRAMASPDIGAPPYAGEPLVPLSSPTGLTHPQRVASRLGYRGGPAHDDSDVDGELGNSPHLYHSPLAGGGTDDSDYETGAAVDDEFAPMPISSPLLLPAYASPRSPFRPAARQLHNQHRRLMSDSQFSAFSEASSFGDTQGHVEMPPSFSTPSREEEEWARGRALEALHQFSTEGLRTLVYAHREVPPDYYESWHQRHLAASTALVSRQQQVEAVCEEIERDLMLSGISAIEDRLQDGVPETIFKLRRAGIRVWMLTGDKVETAINIGKSCRLIDTEAVEQTKLDKAYFKTGTGKMTLLVMQSMTDYDALNRLINEALDVARSLALSVDERFERLTRRQRLARGLKRFGNMLDPRRLRSRKDRADGAATTDDYPVAQPPNDQQAKMDGYMDEK